MSRTSETKQTFGNGTQSQDAGLLHLPLLVEQCLLQYRQQYGQQFVVEDVGKHVEGCSRAFS